MQSKIDKRRLLTAGIVTGASLAAGQAFAQTKMTDDLGRRGEGKAKPIPRTKAKTTQLFLSPPSWPNCISVQEGKGFWVHEQRHDRKPEKAWLLDFKTGKVLHEITTHCEDTSGATWGDGFLWSGANGASVKNPPNPPVNGIFQTDMNSKQISHRQLPFGPKEDGGSCHGMGWENGKIWAYANRMEAIIRIDAKSWETDVIFPVTRAVKRLHGITFDPREGGIIWQVCGTQDPNKLGYEGYTPGLIKYNARNGKVLQIVDFVPGSCDIHDVTVSNGQLYGVDAGEHPGWPIDKKFERAGFPELNSPTGGYICKIDLT